MATETDQDRPYPVTIIMTRYGGTYEGGRWAAFQADEWALPEDATGPDSVAERFWAGEESRTVGRGDTPDEALADMIRRLRVNTFLTDMAGRDTVQLDSLQNQAWE